MSDTIENKTDLELLVELYKEIESIFESGKFGYYDKVDDPEIYKNISEKEEKLAEIEKKKEKYDDKAVENYTFNAVFIFIAIGIILAVLIFRKLSTIYFWQINVLLNIFICGLVIFLTVVIGGFSANFCIKKHCEAKFKPLLDKYFALSDEKYECEKKIRNIKSKNKDIVKAKVKEVNEKYGLFDSRFITDDDVFEEYYAWYNYSKSRSIFNLLKSGETTTIKEAYNILLDDIKERVKKHEADITQNDKLSYEKANTTICSEKTSSVSFIKKECGNCIWIAGRPFAYYCTHTKNLKKGAFNKDDQYMSVSLTSSCDLFQARENHNFKK